MRNPEARRHERGAALMVLLSIILMAGASMAIEALLVKSKRLRDDQKATIALAEAKRALIATGALEAVTRTGFGNLPCPFAGTLADYATNAVAAGACGGNDGVVAVGFLPWRSLGIAPLVDGDNAPLWYAVAGRFKTGSTQTMPYTCDTANLTINGSGNFAAILFSPGTPLALLPSATMQSRIATSTAAGLRDQFLEQENATATTNFRAMRIMTTTAGGVASPPFNDRLLGITCAEMIGAVNQMPL
ncbi:MAG: hypothetical protein HQL91_01120 [Magnetococcales bacterium]|nr:hypothetical protein [Magnetococcales bacterium]